ncbi:MAG: hypothetical protein WC426_02645 [Sulfuriferula sp.]
MKYFSPKAPEETVTLTFDFTAALDAGETINTPVSTVSIISGTDNNLNAILSGTPQLVGTTVTQKVHAGVISTQYSVQVCITTSAGRVLCLAGNLTVNAAVDN